MSESCCAPRQSGPDKCCAIEPASGAAPVAMRAGPRITLADRLTHIKARLGVRRMSYRVAPGLYALGAPDRSSPVLVTANYTLSFDALRGSLGGVDAWILVLDTKGVNVWCAAGKGTFGTNELCARIENSGLANVVDRRRLTLPQLGAPGVAAHAVTRRTGFSVDYGPVRAADVKEYLRTGTASADMRRVTFGLWDRLVLIPIEAKAAALPGLGLAAALWALLGPTGGWAALAGVLAGAALFPILLPLLPGTQFAVQGAALGALSAAPFSADALSRGNLMEAAAYLCISGAAAAFLALNFTGSTTFTSPSAVKREIARYTRPMAVCFGLGLALALVEGAMRWSAMVW